MSEITIKTIESLPLLEEPAEGASIVGWSEGRTVRMPIDAVGGSKGIVFTIESNENAINPVDSDTSEWNVSCNYDFDTFLELYKNGAPMVLVNTSWCTVTHQVCGNWYEGGGVEKSAAPSGPEACLYFSSRIDGTFEIHYTSEELWGNY